MRKLFLALTALVPASAFAQTASPVVSPPAPIAYGTIWTPEQWQQGWASKMDANGGVGLGGSLTGSNLSGSNVTAAGGTAARTLAQRFSGCDPGGANCASQNIKDFYNSSTCLWDCALTAAFTALPATGGTITIPAGNYSLPTPVVLSGKQVTVRGDGVGVTILTPTHTGTALSITPGNLLFHVNVRDLTFVPNASTPTAAALSISYPAISVYATQTVNLENIEILSSGATGSITAPYPNTFTGGVVLNGLWQAHVRNVSFMSVPTATPLAGTFGFEYGNSYNLTFDECLIEGADVGFEELAYSEGIIIRQPTLVGVNTGHLIPTGISPQVGGYSSDSVRIEGGEWDVYNAAVIWTDVVLGWIENAHMAIRNDGSSLNIVKMTGNTNTHVNNNSFNGNSGTATANAVSIIGGGQNVVNNNTCSLLASCAKFDSTSSYSIAIDNMQATTTGYGNGFTDSGTNNFMSWIDGPSWTAYAESIVVAGATGQPLITIPNTPSAANYIVLSAAPAAHNPVITFQGTDTNVGGQLQTSGTGGLTVQNLSAGLLGTELVIAPSSSAQQNNYVRITSGVTGLSPDIEGAGSLGALQVNTTGSGLLQVGGTIIACTTAPSGYLCSNGSGVAPYIK
jgi:hypothetical protein